MIDELRNEIKRLSISERILLVEEIWDSIADENESFQLSQAQKEELEKRSESFAKTKDLGRSWEEIKKEFLSK